MRDIKFRAYDPFEEDDPKMWIISQLNFSPNIEGVIIDDLPRQKQLLLMQYTGAKDKNGVEIYEGDILLTKLLFTYHKTPIDKQKRRRLQVRWTELQYEYQLCYEDGEGLCGFNVSDIDFNKSEVIGNIYENKELRLMK